MPKRAKRSSKKRSGLKKHFSKSVPVTELNPGNVDPSPSPRLRLGGMKVLKGRSMKAHAMNRALTRAAKHQHKRAPMAHAVGVLKSLGRGAVTNPTWSN